MSDASKNRTLSALKAALNYAVSSRYVEAGLAIEWTGVKPHEVTTRRDLYLNRKQRHALVEKLPEHARPFVRGLCLLPLRPDALASATVGDRGRPRRLSGRLALAQGAVEAADQESRRRREASVRRLCLHAAL